MIEALLWIMNTDFGQKHINDGFASYKHTASQDVNWWTGVVWITCRLLHSLIISIQWLSSSLGLLSTCSWCVGGVLGHYGCRRIIQVDAAHWWWMRRSPPLIYVKHFEYPKKRYIDVTNYYYYVVFISCLDSHSDGTHSLQRIHCWASEGMLHFSKSDKETNSSCMNWGWVHFQQIVILGKLFL